MRLPIILLTAVVGFPGTSFAQSVSVAPRRHDEVRASRSHSAREAGIGCIIGGSTAGTLATVGTIGLGTIPATVLGCGLGAAVAPTAARVYDQYRVKGFLAFDDAVTGAYGWWQEQKMKGLAP